MEHVSSAALTKLVVTKLVTFGERVSVKPEKSLRLTEMTHSFRELADPACQFSTHIWLSALRLLIVMPRQFYLILMGGKLK